MYGNEIIAFVKERVHNAVEIDILGIFGRVFIVKKIAPPPPPKNSSGAKDVIAIDHVLCLSHVFLQVSACLFDLLRSSKYSSGGENQPMDENENEKKVRIHADSLKRKKWPT